MKLLHLLYIFHYVVSVVKLLAIIAPIFILLNIYLFHIKGNTVIQLSLTQTWPL